MFWPTLGCSIIAAGLWITRSFVPDALSPYADAAILSAVIAMFIWLARRAIEHGARASLTGFRATLDAPPEDADHSQSAYSDDHYQPTARR